MTSWSLGGVRENFPHPRPCILNRRWYHVIPPGSKEGGVPCTMFLELAYTIVHFGGKLLRFHFAGINPVSEVPTCYLAGPI